MTRFRLPLGRRSFFRVGYLYQLIGALGANEVLAITLGGIAPAIVFCSKFLGGGGRAMVRVAVTGDESRASAAGLNR